MIITFCFFSIGYSLTRLLGVKNKLERLGLGFTLTFGLIGVILFALILLGIRLSPIIVFVIIALGLTSFIFNVKDLKFFKINNWWIAILGVVLLSFLINLYWPVSTWDSLTMYDFRAKFFSLGKLPWELKEIQNYGYYLGNYPFMYSLVLALPHLINSSPTTLISGFFMSLIFIFYSYLRGKKHAEILTLFLSISSMLFVHSTYVYSNFPYSVFLITSAFLISKYLDKREIKYLLLGLFLIVCGSWIRYAEPFYLSIFIVLIACLIKKINKSKIFLIITLLITTIMIRGLWNTYRVDFQKVEYYLPPTINNTNTFNIYSTFKLKAEKLSFVTHKVIENAALYWKYLVEATDVYRVLFFSIIILLVSNKAWTSIVRKPEKYFFTLFSFISIFLLGAGTIFFSTQIPNWFQIPDSTRRMMIFLIPSLLLSISELLEKDS